MLKKIWTKLVEALRPRPKCPGCDGAGIYRSDFNRAWVDCVICDGRGRI